MCTDMCNVLVGVEENDVCILKFYMSYSMCLCICFVIRDYYFNPYPTAFPYGNGMVLHLYQQQESSTTKTVHRVINKGLKTYV